jgi:hypothetical protein
MCAALAFFSANNCNTFHIYRYCLDITYRDTVSASAQPNPDDSVDNFSRQNVFVCFEEKNIRGYEVFLDAVKRTCASADQVLNYIDSLPLANQRQSSLGSKGCVQFSLI